MTAGTSMRRSAEQTNAHYSPLFSQWKAGVTEDALRLEVECLRFELSQVADLPAAGLVLDAGCGTGRYAAAWKALFPATRLVGVDINHFILSDGQVRPQALCRINGDLENLPFRSGTFDVVMSRGAIQHTAHPQAALRELLRVCRPGGVLYFYTYKWGWYDVALGAARRVAGAIGAPRCSRLLYGACGAIGLDTRAPTMILDELFVPIRFAFTEPTILGWLRSSGVPIASITPVTHAQFGDVDLPVNDRTKRLYRWVPKNGLLTYAVRLST
jgi:SAM-dependent methyltransferase